MLLEAYGQQLENYQADAEVEDITGLFARAEISGGDGNNTIVVGDSDNQLNVGGTSCILNF